MSVDMQAVQSKLGTMSSDIKDAARHVQEATNKSEPKRRLVVSSVVALLIVLALIVGYNRFFGGASNVVKGVSQTQVSTSTYKTGQRLKYAVDFVDHKFTVLYVADNGNALVVDQEGDVWSINGEFKPENAEETDLVCDSYAITLALTIPGSVLSNCQKKQYNNNTAFQMDVPVCTNNERLHVLQQSNRIVGYECK